MSRIGEQNRRHPHCHYRDKHSDRTDGKVAQALIGDSEQDAVRVHHTIVRKIVAPDAK